MKRSINLILPQTPEPVVMKMLRQILPGLAAILSLIFIILFIASLIYLQINNREYEEMVSTSNVLEKDITNLKSKEGLYLLVYRAAGTMEKILASSNTHAAFAKEIGQLNTDGITLTQFTLDRPENAQMTFQASSADKLTTLVQLLNQAELNNNISNVQTSDVSRDNRGTYTVSVKFRADPSLLK